MLPCGNAGSCPEFCCYGLQQSCSTGADKCGALQAKMGCNDTADCAMGEVCCAGVKNNAWQSACSATCPVGQNVFVLCTNVAECAAGFATCGNVPGILFPPGYKSCNK